LIETPSSRIDFSLVSAEKLSHFVGYWKVEPTVLPTAAQKAGSGNSGVLLTYHAEAVTNAAPSNIFAGIFSNQISRNLTAIRQEILRRQ
jgi:hypothetical protein